ncbi:MAG: 50S ribosomal protein L25 [Bacteroidota bacterium]|nr:50S ribosomal protein L25 [Bacteroidota bacterium]
MSEVVLQAEVRSEIGKGAKRVRFSGKVPGVYYSHGEKPINISATPLGLKPLIYTSDTHLVNLKLDNGELKTCILRDVQFDPITDRPVHFDLQGIKENEELTVQVPVIIKGSPKGVKDGGTLQHVIHRLKVTCLPKYIPEHVELDVTELGMNHSIHVRDIKIANVHIVDNEASTVVAVVPPTIVKEEAPAEVAVATATPAEPEVIAKGKKPTEGEEAAKPGAAAAAKPGAAAPAKAGVAAPAKPAAAPTKK